MYHTMPHLDYLSIEECMNEHSEEDDQYYLAMGYIEEEPSAEVDAEEIYLSAFDDLSPLAGKPEHRQQPEGHQTPHIPSSKLTVEDQTSRTASETLAEDPKNSRLPEPGLEPQQGVFSTCDLVVTVGLDPKLAKPHEVELDSRSKTGEVEGHLTDQAEIEPVFSMLQIEEANVGSVAGLSVHKTGCPEEVADLKTLDSESGGGNGEDDKGEPMISSLQIEDRNVGNGVDLFVEKTGLPEKVTFQTPRDPESENQPIKSSTEEKWQPQNTSTSEQTSPLPCSVRVDVPPEMVERCNKPLGDTLVVQETGEMHHGDAAQVASSVEELNFLQSLIPSLLDNNPEKINFPAPNPEHISSYYSPASLSDSCMDSEDFPLAASPPKPGLESLLQKPQTGLPVDTSHAPKHELLDGSVQMKLASTTPQVQQVKSFPVVPPKPQFAKLPPSLKPVIPSKEHLIPVLVKTSESGNKQELNQSSLKRPFHLTSLDQRTEHFPASPSGPPSSSENCCCSNSDVLPKQRNSMPVSLEKFSKDCKNAEGVTPKPPPSSRDKCFSWTKSGEVGGSSLPLMKGLQPGRLEKQNSSQHDEGKGYLAGAERPTKEGLETTPQKQRWSNWRYSGSMSFDEAVALAKERHVAQAPMRRMQTYSYGEVDGLQGGSRMEKTAPAHKPVPRSPQRPLSCISPAGPPEAHLPGKMLCPPGLPDSIPESLHTRGQEESSFSQDFPLRNRVSLSKIGRRLSVSDEACFGLSHEQR